MDKQVILKQSASNAALTKKSQRRRKRLRKVFNCVYLCCLISKILSDRRWGMHVEELDNILLQSERKKEPLPSNYFETLSKYPLPPGWVINNLPMKLQHQIRTYAKNLLVRLVTPVAKLRASRIQLRQMVASYKTSAEFENITFQRLRKLSPFFDLWSEPMLNELLHKSRLVAYRNGMWVFPPAATSKIHAFVILTGYVNEVIHQEEKEPIVVQEFDAKTCVAETRRVLRSPSVTGFIARANTICLEMDWRDIEEICLGKKYPLTPALRKFITTNCSQQMYKHFPLSVSTLKNMILFNSWDEGELQLLVQMIKPKIFFDAEEICVQGHSTTDVNIICRGKVSVMIDGVQRRTLGEGDTFGEDAMVFDEHCPATLVSEGTSEVWHISRAAIVSHLKSTSLKRAVLSSAVKLRERFMEQVRNRSYLASRLRDTPEFSKVPIPEDVLAELELLLKPKVFAAGDRFVTGGDEVHALAIVESGKINENNSGGEVSSLYAPCIVGGRFLHRLKWPASMTAIKITECWMLERKDALSVLKHHPVILSMLQSTKQLQVYQRRQTIAVIAPAGGGGGGGRGMSGNGGGKKGGAATSSSRRATGFGSMGLGESRLNKLLARNVSIVEDGNLNRMPANAITKKFFPPTLRSAERATVQKHRKLDRDAQEEEFQRQQKEKEAYKRSLYAPPEIEHLTMYEYEGLHPIAPPPKTVHDEFRQHLSQNLCEAAKKRRAMEDDEEEVVIKDTSKGIELKKDISESLAACKPRVQQMLANEIRRIETREAVSLAAAQATSSASMPGSPTTRARRRGALEGGGGSGGGSTSVGTANNTSSSGGGSGNVRFVPVPPSGSAEKVVFKEIMRKHHEKIRETRQRCVSEAEVSAIIANNPYSNLRRRKAPIPKMSPLGELYSFSPITKESEKFDSTKYSQIVPPSYVSAHGYSELDFN